MNSVHCEQRTAIYYIGGNSVISTRSAIIGHKLVYVNF